MEARYNQAFQETTSTLQEIKAQVVTNQESQEKMWLAIKSMGKELQELPQGDAGTNNANIAEQRIVMKSFAPTWS